MTQPTFSTALLSLLLFISILVQHGQSFRLSIAARKPHSLGGACGDSWPASPQRRLSLFLSSSSSSVSSSASPTQPQPPSTSPLSTCPPNFLYFPAVLTYPPNFITKEIVADLSSNLTVRTRFPPEPNGYLHLGHAKSFLFNWFCPSLSPSSTYSFCNVRFDDTNPLKETEDYRDAIIEDLEWLATRGIGITPEDAPSEDRSSSLPNIYRYSPILGPITSTSSLFPHLRECALSLISNGFAYVDFSTPEGERQLQHFNLRTTTTRRTTWWRSICVHPVQLLARFALECNFTHPPAKKTANKETSPAWKLTKRQSRLLRRFSTPPRDSPFVWYAEIRNSRGSLTEPGVNSPYRGESMSGVRREKGGGCSSFFLLICFTITKKNIQLRRI